MPEEESSHSHHRNADRPPLCRETVFEEENALPSAELHPAFRDRNALAGAVEHHPDGCVVTVICEVMFYLRLAQAM